VNKNQILTAMHLNQACTTQKRAESHIASKKTAVVHEYIPRGRDNLFIIV
jgi:hypothetical protein